MKRILVVLIGLVILLPFLSLATDQKKDSNVQLKSFADKLSYVLGHEIGNSFKESPTEIKLELFIRGIEDSLEGRKSLLEPEESNQIKQEFSRQVRERRRQANAALAETNQKAEEAFLADNKKKQGIVVTDSGLQYKVLQKGDGPKPQRSDTVKVHYRGILLDGSEFDSSYNRGQPATLRVGGVIPGWAEGLQLMNVGSKYRLYIPAKLAYGNRGAGRKISPNEMLIFEVELLGIEK
jgi:FKBP-type peptidyl-prolyl cis-trans isomerase